jgi:plastocyanin
MKAMYTKNSLLIYLSGAILVLVFSLLGLSSMQTLGQPANESSTTISIKYLKMTGTTVSSTGTLIGVSIVPGSSILTDTAFQPNPVSIKVGDTVRWTNDDNMVHTVIEGNPAKGHLPEEGFDSELMST